MQRFYFLLLIFILGVTNKCYAQSDTDWEQQETYAYLFGRDFEKAKDNIESKFLNSTDHSKKIIGMVYLVDYYTKLKKYPEAKQTLEKASRLLSEDKEEILTAYLDYGYASYYAGLNDKYLFRKYVNSSINIFEKQNNNNFILAVLAYLKVTFYVQHHIKNDVRKYYLELTRYAQRSKNPIAISSSYTNLSSYYIKQLANTNNEDYRKMAANALQVSYQYAEKIKFQAARERCLVKYYLQYGELYKNQQAESQKAYAKALQIAANEPKLSYFTPLIYNNIGTYYYTSGEYKTAEKYLLKAYNLSKDNDDTNALNLVMIIDNLANLYGSMKDYDKVIKYTKEGRDITNKYYESLFNNYNSTYEVIYQSEKKEGFQLRQLKNKSIILFIIITVSLIGMALLLYYYRNRLKLKLRKMNIIRREKVEIEQSFIREKEEKNKVREELQLTKTRKEKLYRQILATSLQLEQKNNFLHNLSTKVSNQEDINIERELKEDKIISDDVKNIKILFEEIHPGFYRKLIEISGRKLTDLDLKYAGYIYLHMNNRDISQLLKTDPNTVKIQKYRLKQKIGLPKDQDLNLFLQNLSF
ncbi:tetratricopeptide repeat protein [Chryseobacterium sp. KLBC 52]|uniref:tetratricopeptide repeat protein n=1 Tax=Chryseobacterium sp. KLBC 52 TaxID=1862702 RepID=UPI000E0BD8AB|nr:tetratricopeptide repeat protein [Chryseobacterium sp. KLBC 52]